MCAGDIDCVVFTAILEKVTDHDHFGVGGNGLVGGGPGQGGKEMAGMATVLRKSVDRMGS